MFAVEPAQPPRFEHTGWEAKLTLGFHSVGARTVLQHRAHTGPLRVQRPFYPEGEDLCHVYVLHPPGGLVGGDRVHVDVTLERDAKTLLTTPAATKFYRSAGRLAQQSNTLTLGARASCEWLPQETIVFGGSRAVTRTRVELGDGARFAGWDVTCLGRPAAGDGFSAGSYTSSFEMWRAGGPLWIDRALCSQDVLKARWGLRGCPVFGTFVLAPALPRAALDTLRDTVSSAGDDTFAVSSLQEVTVCRYLGHSTQRALQCFQHAWQLVRPLLFARPASPPRIWLT
jgi:urease accessory protein